MTSCSSWFERPYTRWNPSILLCFHLAIIPATFTSISISEMKHSQPWRFITQSRAERPRSQRHNHADAR
ncbi:hypothetical protein BDP81DRAFT_421366 [Colletotrichum phormii]|uniref:Uncharacterized protein n=1 Tax=Colletotrichum phormii TaxID=359342 RepID=A0AAI9ZWN5_9PEZI|nr:uncharacterized protein BDP81DRAFT_421366 [Colletotrichum phormii]KAK1639589.1 hypothetical protein BDP81DRAFT_421366 [Colletotrichum phormii]